MLQIEVYTLVIVKIIIITDVILKIQQKHKQSIKVPNIRNILVSSESDERQLNLVHRTTGALFRQRGRQKQQNSAGARREETKEAIKGKKTRWTAMKKTKKKKKKR